MALLVGILYLGAWKNHELRQLRDAEAAAVRAAHESARLLEEQQQQQFLRAEQLQRNIVTVSAAETDDQPIAETANTSAGPGPSTIAESEEDTASSPVTEYVGTELFGVPRETLPDWTTDEDENDSLIVLQSGKHATVEAAERDLLEQLRKTLHQEFVQQHPQASGWSLSDDTIVESGALQKRAVERSQIEVGDHKHPMYEVYWQVDTRHGASRCIRRGGRLIVKAAARLAGGRRGTVDAPVRIAGRGVARR